MRAARVRRNGAVALQEVPWHVLGSPRAAHCPRPSLLGSEAAGRGAPDVTRQLPRFGSIRSTAHRAGRRGL